MSQNTWPRDPNPSFRCSTISAPENSVVSCTNIGCIRWKVKFDTSKNWQKPHWKINSGPCTELTSYASVVVLVMAHHEAPYPTPSRWNLVTYLQTATNRLMWSHLHCMTFFPERRSRCFKKIVLSNNEVSQQNKLKFRYLMTGYQPEWLVSNYLVDN